MQEKIRALIEKEVQAVKSIPVPNGIEKAVKLIHQRVHKQNGKCVISGMGKAGQIGINMATTFSSTGTPSVYLHPSEAQHGDIGLVQENDVVFLISNSGKTREIVELVSLVRNLHPNMAFIGLTGHPDSMIKDLVDVVIFTGNPDEICPMGLTPTTSTTTMTVIGDVMVVLLMEMINFTKDDYSKRHHSGYLGQKAKESGQ